MSESKSIRIRLIGLRPPPFESDEKGRFLPFGQQVFRKKTILKIKLKSVQNNFSFTGNYSNIYKKRRENLTKFLEEDSYLIINSASNVIRNNDTTFPFRQNSNFFYLTGFNEPECVLLLNNHGNTTFFCRPKNPDLEKWDGFMHGIDGAKENFAFDDYQTYEIYKIMKWL